MTDVSHRVQQLLSERMQPFTQSLHVCSFTSAAVPEIDVLAYLDRFYAYANVSSSCLEAAYHYIVRYCKAANLPLHALNVHRLLAVGIRCASKFLEDRPLNARDFAVVSGINNHELIQLEQLFLFTIKFDLSIPDGS